MLQHLTVTDVHPSECTPRSVNQLALGLIRFGSLAECGRIDLQDCSQLGVLVTLAHLLESGCTCVQLRWRAWSKGRLVLVMIALHTRIPLTRIDKDLATQLEIGNTRTNTSLEVSISNGCIVATQTGRGCALGLPRSSGWQHSPAEHTTGWLGRLHLASKSHVLHAHIDGPPFTPQQPDDACPTSRDKGHKMGIDLHVWHNAGSGNSFTARDGSALHGVPKGLSI